MLLQYAILLLCIVSLQVHGFADTEIKQDAAQGSKPIINTGNKNVIDNSTHHYGIPPEAFAKYAADLGVTDGALNNFFRILQQNQVPRYELDSKLREIAQNYKKLLDNAKMLEISDDPIVTQYLQQARQLIEGKDENGNDVEVNFVKADEWLQKAFEQEQAAIAQLLEAEQKARQAREKRQVSSANIMAQKKDIAKTQLHYAQAGKYYQQAAELLPSGHEEDQARYLNDAGLNFYHTGLYQQALPLYQQALEIREQVLGTQHPFYATSLNNLAGLYYVQNQYKQALPFFKQAVTIVQNIFDENHPTVKSYQRNYKICLGAVEQDETD